MKTEEVKALQNVTIDETHDGCIVVRPADGYAIIIKAKEEGAEDHATAEMWLPTRDGYECPDIEVVEDTAAARPSEALVSEDYGTATLEADGIAAIKEEINALKARVSELEDIFVNSQTTQAL